MEFILLLVILVFVALVSYTKSALELSDESYFTRQTDEEPDKYKDILALIEDKSSYVKTARSLIVLGYVVMGVILERIAITYLNPIAAQLGSILNVISVRIVLLVLSWAGVVYLAILIGKFIPTSLSAVHPEVTAYKMYRFMKYVSICMRGVIWIFDKSADAIFFVLRISPEDLEDNVTEDEIKSIVNEGFEQGVLEDSEVEMISNIMEMDEKKVKDIMTHRKKVVLISQDMQLEEALKFMLEKSYSRFPVYDEERDNIIGVVHLKDVMQYYVGGDNKNVTVHEVIRKPYFVPDTQGIEDVLEEMQSKKIHMAIAIDEYGQFAGIVAMEDIIEEIVGNIFDEYDVDERMIIRQPNNKFLMKGLTPIEEVEEALDIKVEQDAFDTLNGLLIFLMGHLPKDNEKSTVSYKGYVFHLIETKKNMIKRVRVEPEVKKEIL